jgi:phosphoadenosine phosphosulfate reductase
MGTVNGLQYRLIGEPSDRELVAEMSLDEKVQRAINLIRQNEPEAGYYGAFSGGKDSCVIKALATMAGVRVEWRYNNVTIDAPEMVRFLKRHHPDVGWNQPKHGNMLHRIAVTAPKTAPTRNGRWCCEEYKEGGGAGRVKLFGVRQQESPKRKAIWREVAEDLNGDKAMCPIVFWSGWTEILDGKQPGPDAIGHVLLLGDVWDFIRAYDIPYCPLYDEGFERMGCIDCCLASNKNRERERQRWPRMAELIKRAVIANWERLKDVPNTKTGEPRFHARFDTGEQYYQWWATGNSGMDLMRECQSGLLWTNEEMTPDSDVPETGF